MGRSFGCHGLPFAWLAAALFCASPAFAADIETRDFSVFVGGKPAGEVHMTIHRQDDGTTQMRCDTDVKVKVGIVDYKFIYRGSEVWKNQRLVKFDSVTDDNGKRYTVTAKAEEKGIGVKVNNQELITPLHTWLTSYWTLPDIKLREAELPILDADNGNLLSGTLKFVATEKITVAGQTIPLNHYRLSGKISMDLWYDGSDRLVRQEWTEQGHKTIVELIRVRR